MLISGEIILVLNCNLVGINIKVGEYILGCFDLVNGINWNCGYYYDVSEVVEFVKMVMFEEFVVFVK